MNSDYSHFIDVLEEKAATKPDQVALVFLSEMDDGKKTELSYTQLFSRTLSLSSGLREKARQGDRVLILCPSGPDYMVSFFACLAAGCIAVPAYPPRPNEHLARLEYLCSDSEPTTALTVKSTHDIVQKAAEKNPFLKTLQWIVVDEFYSAEKQQNRFDIEGDDIAFLQYTSGSIAEPKGVIVTHRNIMHNVRTIESRLGQQTSGVNWLPPYHDLGLIANILYPLYTGFKGVHMSPIAFLRNPQRWLRAMSDFKASASSAPNFGYEYCCDMIEPEDLKGIDLSHWKVALNAAEPVRKSTLDRFESRFAEFGFNGSAFCTGYGLAESTVFVSCGYRGGSPKFALLDRRKLEENRIELANEESEESIHVAACGPGYSGQEIRIVNPENCLPVIDDSVGEIWLSSDSIAQGYWKKTDLTREIFGAQLAGSQKKFLRTGDTGFVRDGELYITGRIKELIIIRGRNYHPHDIELSIRESSQLLSSSGAAFSFQMDGEEKLAVVHELRRGFKDSELEGLHDLIMSAVIKDHGIAPARTVLVKPGIIPRTTSGKVRRNLTRTQYLAGQLRACREW